MERGILRAFVVVGVLVFGMHVGQSHASFQECYVGCFVLCMLIPSQSPFSCATQCLKDCIIPNSPQDNQVDNHDFCKLGCASSLCTKISTRQNPNGKKVESCVGSCSGLCSKNYKSP